MSDSDGADGWHWVAVPSKAAIVHEQSTAHQLVLDRNGSNAAFSEHPQAPQQTAAVMCDPVQGRHRRTAEAVRHALHGIPAAAWPRQQAAHDKRPPSQLSAELQRSCCVHGVAGLTQRMQSPDSAPAEPCSAEHFEQHAASCADNAHDAEGADAAHAVAGDKPGAHDAKYSINESVRALMWVKRLSQQHGATMLRIAAAAALATAAAVMLTRSAPPQPVRSLLVPLSWQAPALAGAAAGLSVLTMPPTISNWSGPCARACAQANPLLCGQHAALWQRRAGKSRRANMSAGSAAAVSMAESLASHSASHVSLGGSAAWHGKHIVQPAAMQLRATSALAQICPAHASSPELPSDTSAMPGRAGTSARLLPALPTLPPPQHHPYAARSAPAMLAHASMLHSSAPARKPGKRGVRALAAPPSYWPALVQHPTDRCRLAHCVVAHQAHKPACKDAMQLHGQPDRDVRIPALTPLPKAPTPGPPHQLHSAQALAPDASHPRAAAADAAQV